jgi:hypothetical protein
MLCLREAGIAAGSLRKRCESSGSRRRRRPRATRQPPWLPPSHAALEERPREHLARNAVFKEGAWGMEDNGTFSKQLCGAEAQGGWVHLPRAAAAELLFGFGQGPGGAAADA